MRIFVWFIAISCALESLGWLINVKAGRPVERSIGQQAFLAVANAILAVIGFAILFR